MKRFDKVAYPVFLISDDKVVYINIATSIFLGYTPEEIIGKEYANFIGKKIRYETPYTDIGRFSKKKDGSNVYAFTVNPLEENGKRYAIVELKGLDIGNKIFTSVKEKRYRWGKEEIIELIAKESLASTNIDRIRIYIAKDKNIENVDILYEYTKHDNKSKWKTGFTINNLPIYEPKSFSEVWTTLRDDIEFLPPALKKIIDKERINFLICKPIFINPRTLYILSYEKLGSDREVSSLDINLFFYTHTLLKEMLAEKVKDIYLENLAQLRKELLSIDTREKLMEVVSTYVPIPYDQIIIGASLEEGEEVGILIKEKERIRKVIIPIPEKSVLSEFVRTADFSTKKADYTIIEGEKFRKAKGTISIILDKLGIKWSNSTLIISLRDPNKRPANFIWLLKKEKNYYSHLDFEQLDPFVKEILLVLEKFRGMEEAERERARAENALKIQKFFLERISHEFRTPITGILGFTDLLYDIVKNEIGRDYLNAIRESTVRLLNLVDKLLLLARLETGYVVPGETAFTFFELELWLREKLKKEIKPSISYMIHMPSFSHPLIGDLDKIKIVFKELIENAIKFTNEGRIDIKGTIQEENIDSIRVRFSIKDTGVGISDEKIKYIFSNFAQEEEDIARSYEGMGLGLSIAKKMVETMDGVIWVDSNKEKGSTFYFELKLRREIKDELFNGKKILILSKDELLSSLLKIYINSINAIPLFDKKEKYDLIITDKDVCLPFSKKEVKYILWQKVEEARGKIKKEEKNLKILVAEDNPLNYKYIKMVLESFNFIPENAKDGKEAVDMFKQKPYNLIIMDIQMPIMDGIEATKEIRKIDKEIPIIALTAAAVEEVEKKAREAGVNEYITKPFVREDIIKVLTRYLGENGQKSIS